MATTVKITETYDMKTTVNKMGIVGVHTPQMTLIKKLYPGLMKNHKFVRFIRCDVVGACASVLPADPLQVGVEAGDIAPEDMFNPILYKAVTNESFDTLVARVRNLSDISPLKSVAEGDMWGSGANADFNFNTYYAFLAENGEFRKSMPQSGFVIRNLVPLAHTLISNFGNVGGIGNDLAVRPEEDPEPGDVPVPNMDVPEVDGESLMTSGQAVFYRGRSVRMPKIPLHYRIETDDTIDVPNVPKTHVLAMILPPARLHEFWYRMRVSWTVRFEEVCSTNFYAHGTGYSATGALAYARNYTYSSSKESLPDVTDSVESQNVNISKVMES